MKLFENGVGRPSNEIKQKRRIFVVSAIALCVALISVLAFALTRVNTNSMKGATGAKTTKKVTYTKSSLDMDVNATGIWCDPAGKSCKDKNIGLQILKKGTAVKYASAVTCTNLSDCKRDDAWDIASSKNKTARWPVTQIYNTVKLSEDTKTIEKRTFYVRVTTYIANNSSNWGSVKVYEVKPTSYTTQGNNRWLTSSKVVYSKVNSKLVTTKKVVTKTGKLAYTSSNTGLDGKITSMWCNPTGKSCKDKKMNLIILSKGNYAKYFSVVTCTSKGDCTKDNAWDVAASKNKTNRLVLNKGSRTINLSETTKTIQDRKFYVRVTTYVSNSASMWANAYVYEVSPSSYQENGNNRWITNSKLVYKTYNRKIITTKKAVATKTVKKTNTASKVNKITLSCPSSAKVGQEFKCTVNDTGVKITVGEASALASGYSSTFITTAADKTKSIKYTSELFTKYKTIIKKDSNGKEYIYAQVTVSKSGYSTVIKKVKIYK